MNRPHLTDAQWALIRPYLPRPARTGRPRADDRRTIEGILCELITGCRWQDLPREYGAPTIVWRRLKRWGEEDIWERIWRPTLAALDVQSKLDWAMAFLDDSFAPAKNGSESVCASLRDGAVLGQERQYRMSPQRKERAMDLKATDVDWQGIEDRLLAFSMETVRRFASEHPEEICSFFAYDVDLPYFLLSFDAPENALRVAQQTEQDAIARRTKMLTLPTAWRGARHFSSSPPVLDYSYSTGYFAYHIFADIKVDELEDLAFAEDYPQDETADDYAVGKTRIVLWRVLERLIDSGELRHLHLASPCRLGYQMHDDELTVLRILNWPQCQ